MARKRKSTLRAAGPLSMEEINRLTRKYRTARAKRNATILFFLIMVVAGTYMLITEHAYSKVYKAASYTKTSSDNNQYVAFHNGIVRYSRNGVTYLNHKNKELWIQSGQFKNPIIDVNKNVFAIADCGGNSVQIFDRKGLKGEFETTLPVEKISISNQGVISIILKNGNTPYIVTYDSSGNILVENEVSVSSLGYPTALDMSEDGTVLAVTYLDTGSGSLKSKVICYNFGEKGKNKTNHIVSQKEYDEEIMPEIYFMDKSNLVVVSDHSFIIYSGKDVPKKKKEVTLKQEIQSTFHTSKYIGFILLKEDKTGYEVCLYNKAGKQIMCKDIKGEYSNVSMTGSEIIMYEGSRYCVITKTGVERVNKDLGMNILSVIPANGINKYWVMGTNELRVIYLVR